MKKKILFLLAAAILWLPSSADEGMWMLPYLKKMNIRDMQQKGCKLSASDIYNVNGSSLKDAIVVFGGGCTGEIVSPEGLILTNHHCGYASIQALSSVDHDYLENGFWAQTGEEEIPAPGLQVRFVRRIEEVTDRVVGNVPDIACGEERARIVDENIETLRSEMQEAEPGMEIEIKSFFGGNQYFAFVVEVYSDVRLVGTPPNSIGKFGGDTDNWMWPRHTGDFSVFRVYASPDNKPAAYSPENVPLRTKNYLKISIAGYHPNSFTMIMGFPGSTDRYMTSYEIDRMLEVENPQRIFLRGERQEILKEDMASSDRIRIQYASKYAMSSNYWKNSIGMSRGLRKLDVKSKKQVQEAAFQRWAESPKTQSRYGDRYVNVLDDIRISEELIKAPAGTLQYLREALGLSVEILIPARILQLAGDSIPDARRDQFKRMLKDFYKDYSPSTDRKVAKRMIRLVKENVKDLPAVFATIDERFGGDTDAYVDDMYDRTAFAEEQSALALLDDFAPERLKADPVYPLMTSVLEKLFSLREEMKESSAALRDAQRLYIDGLMKMEPKKAWAPDANFSLRLTYGQVLPYDPADGVTYHYYTTLKGVMEKEDSENPEFVVPERLKELYAARDYGRYANEQGELPIAFLANCDITGGNSGSPVMDHKGRLIGLAFDGNWEAMSGDVAFEPDLQRTISVDIRYVLFIIDKYAGAQRLIREMKIERK